MKNLRPKGFVGIDPGLTGCACMLTDSIISFHDWESLQSAVKKIEIWGYEYHLKAILEKPQMVPGKGKFGQTKGFRNFGNWEGVLEALHCKYDIVTPQYWQKQIYQYKKRPKGFDTKAMALKTVKEIFPEITTVIYRKKDHDRAEALLMAYFLKLRG